MGRDIKGPRKEFVQNIKEWRLAIMQRVSDKFLNLLKI